MIYPLLTKAVKYSTTKLSISSSEYHSTIRDTEPQEIMYLIAIEAEVSRS